MIELVSFKKDLIRQCRKDTGRKQYLPKLKEEQVASTKKIDWKKEFNI